MKRKGILLLLTAFTGATALLGTSNAQETANELDSLKKRASYAIGMDIAGNMRQQGVDLDGTVLAKAINDVFAEKDTLLTAGEARSALQDFQ